jgi:hypothetical protein
MIPRHPDYMAAARAELARRAEAEHPGWTFAHDLYGWTATRDSDGRTLTAQTIPALSSLISLARPPEGLEA